MRASVHHGISSSPKKGGVFCLHHFGVSSSGHCHTAAALPQSLQLTAGRRNPGHQPGWRFTRPQTQDGGPLTLRHPRFCKRQKLDSCKGQDSYTCTKRTTGKRRPNKEMLTRYVVPSIFLFEMHLTRSIQRHGAQNVLV